MPYTPPLVKSIHLNAIREFNELRRKTKEHRDLERVVIEAIIRYIIENRYRPWKLTIREIEKGVKINYTRLRSLLLKVAKEGILKQVPVGNSILFNVFNLTKAVENGYLNFSEDELLSMFSLATPLNVRVRGTALGDELLKSLPMFTYWPALYDKISNALEPVFTKVTSMEKIRGQMVYLSIPLYKTLLTEFEYPEDFVKKFQEELGINEQIEMERFVPLAYNILIREVLFELNCNSAPSKGEIQQALKNVFEKQLKLILYFSGLLVKEVKQGISSKLASFKIRAEIATIKFAVAYVKAVDGDLELIKEAEERLVILNKALEDISYVSS